MVQLLMQRCWRDGFGPGPKQVQSHRCEPHPLREPLSIHLASQHAQLNQPDQGIFRARAVQAAAAQVAPITPHRQFRAAQGALDEQAVERMLEGQTAHGLPRPLQGALGEQGLGGSGQSAGTHHDHCVARRNGSRRCPCQNQAG